jgi:arylsulfatase A-like enzyme
VVETLRRRSKTARATVALLGLLAATAWAEASQPHILLVAVDDQTYQFTSAFRPEGPDTTPNLRAIAERGVLFEDGVVQAAQCAPSRNSTITGRYPHQLGYYGNGDRDFLPKDIRGFPESLQQAGYYTAFFGKSHLSPDQTGLGGSSGKMREKGMIRQFGFDYVMQHVGRFSSLKAAQRARERLAAGGAWEYGDNRYLDHLYDRGLLDTFIADDGRPTSLPADDYQEGFIARHAVDWIASYDRSKPFFMYVNFSAPHKPHDQPPAYQDLYDAGDLAPIVDDPDLGDIPDVMKRHPAKGGESKQRADRVGHASFVAYLDEQLGRLLEALEARGLREDTLIVYYSDHGVMLGDHGLMKKETLYDQVLNANLVIDLPDALYPERKDRFRRPVEVLDAVQTMLHAAGVPDNERARYEGESLLPVLTDAVRGNYTREYVFAQLGEATAVVSKQWKYIDHPTTPVLFDRVNDPDELVNVIDEPAHADVVAAHRAALADLYARTGEPLTPCGDYPAPSEIEIGGKRYLPPPFHADLRGTYPSLSKYRDSCKIAWARLKRAADTGGDAQAWCKSQGAGLANEKEVERFVGYLNANGGRLALDRAGWPRDGRRHFIAKGNGSFKRLIKWNGSEFVVGNYLPYSGHPLCVR